MMLALGRFLVDGAVSLVRGWQSALLAIATIAAAVFVLGVALVVSQAFGESLTRWERAGEISVFLVDEVSDDDRKMVAALLEASPVVAGVTFLAPDEASRAFARAFPELGSLVDALPVSPLPAIFEVRLAALAGDAADVDALVDALEHLPGVADVRYDRVLIERVSQVVAVGRWGLVGLAGLLACAAAIAVLSVVRLSYVDRRDEVEVLALVGAPVSAIRGPFVAEGWLQGTSGAVVAMVLLFVAVRAVRAEWGGAMAMALGLDTVPFLSPWTSAVIVAAAGAVGAMAGRLAVGRRALRLP